MGNKTCKIKKLFLLVNHNTSANFIWKYRLCDVVDRGAFKYVLLFLMTYLFFFFLSQITGIFQRSHLFERYLECGIKIM